MSNQNKNKLNLKSGIAAGAMAAVLTAGGVVYKESRDSERAKTAATPIEVPVDKDDISYPQTLQSNSLGQMPAAANKVEAAVVDIDEQGVPVEVAVDNHANDVPAPTTSSGEVILPAGPIPVKEADPFTTPAGVPGENGGSGNEVAGALKAGQKPDAEGFLPTEARPPAPLTGSFGPLEPPTVG